MDVEEFFIAAAIAIGLVSVCKSLLNFVRWVWVMFVRPPKNLKEYGSWAVVTGSTDGIGKALAFEMASVGLNLVLVGRNPSKLEATSNGIRQKYGDKVEIKNIVMDLATLSGEEIARAIEEGIKGLDVGVLVNNAGVAYPYAKFFHEVDLEVVESITKVNIEAATWVSRAVLPGMLKKKKGAIANIGSGSSVIVPSYPLYTVYAASKAYLAMFSRCTSVEYKQQGIDIQCQESSLGTKRCNRKTHWGIAVNLIWKRTGSPGWLHPLYSLVFSCMELICRDWTVSLPMFTRKVARKQTVSLIAWGSFRPRE